MPQSLPIIGITPDIDQADGRGFLRPHYARMIGAAGGVPIALSPQAELVPAYLELCDALVFTGGDDPIMEQWGTPTHPLATKVHPDRQRFEIMLLRAAAERPDLPVLGICLGMQMMALHAGGVIDQYLPESSPEIARRHWGRTVHAVEITLRVGSTVQGTVLSHHRQAITDPGRLQIVGVCPDDGMIEAVADPARRHYIGVQWHPERTEDDRLGAALFRDLVRSASRDFKSTSAQGS